MVKVGVVGLGVMGQHHARVYSQLGCEFVGVVDADEDKARTVGEHYGVPYYADHRELVSQVDAVSIVVPTSLHRKVAMDFLSKGVHCLVEKPIASKLEDAEVIVSGGRGMGGPDGFEMLRKLANTLDAAVGASRPPWPCG